MATKNTHVEEPVQLEVNQTLENVRHFWSKSGKQVTIVLGALVVLIGGYFAYKQFVTKPKEAEAVDKSFMAEKYFAIDSVALALNGDGVNPGFEKIAKTYSGTPTGNLANFYTGVCYIKLNLNQQAVEYLEKFSTDSKPVQQRAYMLLGDAYGDLGKGDKALGFYKKAAAHFTESKENSSEALFRGAYLAQHVLNNKDEVINLYKELKDKYPNTQLGFEADKYLAQLGVYNAN